MKLSALFNFFKKKEESKYTNNIHDINELKIEGLDSETLVQMGIDMLKSKQYLVAIQLFSKAIELDSRNINAYLERSKARRAINDKKRADSDYNIAKKMIDDLDNGLNAYDLANKYYDSGDYEKALKYYSKSLELTPSLTNIYFYRGFCKKMTGDYEGAINDFNRSIMVDNDNKAESFHQRGKIKKNIDGDKKSALSDFNKAIELNPMEADYYSSKASVLEGQESIELYNKAIQINPTNAIYYFSRALKKSETKDFIGSVDDVTIFIELAPKDEPISISEAYSFRGSIKMIFNEFNDALIDYDKAIELNPKNGAAYYERGILKEALGNEDGASMDFVMAKLLDYDDDDGDIDE